MTVFAVIPARGGSKGIPRKNMRLMQGKPLVSYAIENALSSKYIDQVIVTSDSNEILSFADQFERVIVVRRSSDLSEDAVTLDPVIYDAIIKTESLRNESCDTVVTLQPTSPLLNVNTLDAALESFSETNLDTLISVVNDPHLSWKRNNGAIVPGYSRRVNRQQLPPYYVETGAFLICQRSCMTPNSRFGSNVSVFEMPPEESIDIDTWQDWSICEAILGRKRIAYRVDGHKELGLGHVYRALTIAYSMTEHDVVFLCDSSCQMGIQVLRTANMHVIEIQSDEELVEWVALSEPDIYIHDCLDSTMELMGAIKPHVGRLVSFEDLGPGARLADAVINAIYEGASRHNNTYSGKSYVALRDEFLTSIPSYFSDEVHRAFVMFGGTDPLDLSARIFDMAKEFNSLGVKISFDILLGPGYSGSVAHSLPQYGINIIRGVVRVSDYMRKADIAFSSQGRSTFELASLGVPTIVLAQNAREQLHRFAQMDNGFINLGLGSEVSDEDIRSTFEWLISSRSIRYEMHRLMLDNDLKSGIGRVKGIILGDRL